MYYNFEDHEEMKTKWQGAVALTPKRGRFIDYLPSRTALLSNETFT